MNKGATISLAYIQERKKNRYAWTELPMPNKVIEQVHRLAVAAKKYEGLVLTDINGNILTDQLMEDV